MKKLFSLILVIVMFITVFVTAACKPSGENSQGEASVAQSQNSDEQQSAGDSYDSVSNADNEGSHNNTSEDGGISASSGQSASASASGSDSSSSSGSSGGSGSGGDANTPYQSKGEAQYAAKGGDYPAATDGDIYLSPTGSDSNAGTAASPMYSLNNAVEAVKPGANIFMMPGTYEYSARVNLAKSGTESAPITIQAYNWGEVVLDFSNQPYGFNSSKYVGVYITGDYWKIHGITICHAGDNGIKLEGSHNYIGRCVFHHCGDTGVQLGFGHTTSNPNGLMCAYNTVENCDSYLNYDFDNWGDADGFACKMHNGKGNIFIGCRAWHNCDDAWDLFETDWAVEIIDCWAWASGKKEDFSGDEYFSSAAYIAKKNAAAVASGDSDIKNKTIKVPTAAGNGNGIKTGGNGSGGNSKGTHVVYNCVSFNNDITSSVKGFDENNHKGGVIVEHCVGWDNGYSFMFEEGGSNNSFSYNIAFYVNNKYKKTAYGQIRDCTNLFNNNFVTTDSKGMLMVSNAKVFTEDDFITLAESDALASRGADGSLPNNGFARLKTTSKYYGSGMGLI